LGGGTKIPQKIGVGLGMTKIIKIKKYSKNAVPDIYTPHG
jgi:hypothetical protein